MIYNTIEQYEYPDECIYECPYCGERENAESKPYCDDCEQEKINVSVPRNF